jgi:predicted AlkP superfamily pyrophosphatase or phosphodiesterase
VHFHGIDDVSHAYGPDSEAVFNKIAETDEWIGQLAAGWQGEILVTADHGQHESADQAGRRGVHGDFLSSDIFVPILAREK